jgi:hypothetical protein
VASVPVEMAANTRSRMCHSFSRSVLHSARQVTVPPAVIVAPEAGSTPLSFKEVHIFDYCGDRIDDLFHGVRTRVGAWERPAVRRLSMADTNAVMWMSRRPPFAETGSWSSSLGACKDS